MKRWKLPLAALLLILVCFVVYYGFQLRSAPDSAKATDPLVKPKNSRPVRKNMARSEQAKKMVEKTGVGDAATGMSYGCLKESPYDEATGILRTEIDFDCDGIPEKCKVEELNAYGEPIRTENYKDCGEVPTHCYENEYNEYGEKIAYVYDRDCDGSIDKCGTFKRNDHGDIIERINDKGCDGVLEEGELHRCFTYVYDEDNLVISQHGGNCGEEPNSCSDYEYDFATGMKRLKWDLKCDGTVEGCMEIFYHDDPDKSDRFIDDEGCDGIWEGCVFLGDDGVKSIGFGGHEVCAKKYEELVKKNRGKR
jgi:hypothetical protein